jgi:hypothetical protein
VIIGDALGKRWGNVRLQSFHGSYGFFLSV